MLTLLSYVTMRCRQVAPVAAALLVIAVLHAPSVSAQDQRAAARFRLNPPTHEPFPDTTLATRRLTLLSRGHIWYVAEPRFPAGRQPASRGKYALWGAALGGAVGFGVGYALVPESCGDGCWAPPITYPLSGLLLGALAGTLIGLVAHSWAVEASGAPK
jgi:hypothetical protein